MITLQDSSDDQLIIVDPRQVSRFDGYVVLTHEGKLVVPGSTDLYWRHSDLPDAGDFHHMVHHLGIYRNHGCYSVELTRKEVEGLDASTVSLRDFLGQIPEGLFRLLGRALQINEWYRGHRYCGYCGEPTRLLEGERAMTCSSCGVACYPRLSPCIMALLIRGNECLLARNKQWTRPFFSALAGFIEPGESAEQAVRREVMEEVGLEVGRLEYFRSQPWPFPGQLMIGFFAEYARGEIRVDDIEIAEARWFRVDRLPSIPGEFALSGQLIRAFVDRCR